MSIAPQLKTCSFYSRGRGEKLIRQPELYIETAVGRKIKQQGSVSYDFAPDGRLEVHEGQDVLPDGREVFSEESGRMEATLQDAVSWLTSHQLFNERFWWEGHEPDRPLPTEDDFMAIVMDASVALEVEPVQVALAQELDTHNRPMLVNAARRALETIERTRTEMTAQQEEPPAAV